MDKTIFAWENKDIGKLRCIIVKNKFDSFTGNFNYPEDKVNVKELSTYINLADTIFIHNYDFLIMIRNAINEIEKELK